MERLRQTIVSNIQIICKLKDYPTHQLRVIHINSCFPEIQHETRSMSSILRPFSGDSRYIVLDAITTTIRFIQHDFPLGEEKLRHICDMMNDFLDGLHIFKVKYEHDIGVTTRIESLTNELKSYISKNELCEHL